jgi:hypothetical protein
VKKVFLLSGIPVAALFAYFDLAFCEWTLVVEVEQVFLHD